MIVSRDPGTTIIDQNCARLMLKHSGLNKKERAQVFINAGSAYVSMKIGRKLSSRQAGGQDIFLPN